VELAGTTERMPSEQKWYALTGRIVDVKVEADGDIHIALADATGNNVGTVSAEIPVGPKWCEIRQTVFGWTTQKFPFNVKTAHTLKLREPHVITVTGNEATVERQQKGMEVLTTQLKEQDARIQKVSAQLEVSKPAPQVVNNP
jgi:hypothetical protein